MTDEQQEPADPDKVKAGAAVLAMAFLLGLVACCGGLACFAAAWWLNSG